MSEEEKEAIKYLEFLSNEKCECEACQRAKKEYKTILNLLDKQQKEIEELRQYKESVEGLKSKNKTIIDNNELRLFLKRDYISKDKIREKIKELEERAKQEKTITFYCNSNDIARTVISNFNELLEE